MRIYSTSSGFPPGDIRIYRGAFRENSRDGHNSYSDILLEPNPSSGYNPADIAFIGCYQSSAISPKPRYVIQDNSSISRRCLITDGLFKRTNYSTGISNRPQAIRECFNYGTGDLLTESELHSNWIVGNYNLGLGDRFVAIDANDGQRTVNLPFLSNMPVGRIFYVTKSDGTTNAGIIPAQSGQKINGSAYITLNGQRQAYMVIHAGTEWLGIRIA